MIKKPTNFFLISLLICFISCGSSSQSSGDDDDDDDSNSNLIAHYTFEEGFGTTAGDSSDNDNSGTISGATWTTGRDGSGSALQFDGVDDYVQIPGVGETPPTAVSSLSYGTISVWFKFDEEAGETGYYLPIFYIGPSAEVTGTNSGVIIEIGHLGVEEAASNNQKIFYTVTIGDSFAEPIFCFDSNRNLDTGEWYHFVVTISESEDIGNHGYLNKEEMTVSADTKNFNFGDETDSYFLNSATSGMLAIGYGRSATDGEMRHFQGTIDDVRIYNTVLTASEIQALYEE